MASAILASARLTGVRRYTIGAAPPLFVLDGGPNLGLQSIGQMVDVVRGSHVLCHLHHQVVLALGVSDERAARHNRAAFQDFAHARLHPRKTVAGLRQLYYTTCCRYAPDRRCPFRRACEAGGTPG